jgi:hypothetical protein
MAGTLHESVSRAGGLAFMAEFPADPSQVAANQLGGRDLRGAEGIVYPLDRR